MSARRKRLSLNEVLEDHQELRRSVGELRSFIESVPATIDPDHDGEWVVTLSDHLVDLGDHLARHFKEEERTDMHQTLADRFPRAGTRLLQLRGEHDAILTDVRAILAASAVYARSETMPSTFVLRWAENVLGRIGRHERTETELIQRLRTEDLGTND